MSATREGGLKAAITNKARQGDDWYKKIGAKGGRNGSDGGYASSKVGDDGMTGRERAIKSGSKGGSHSKRGYTFLREAKDGLEFIDKVTNEVVRFEHARTLENHNRSTKI